MTDADELHRLVSGLRTRAHAAGVRVARSAKTAAQALPLASYRSDADHAAGSDEAKLVDAGVAVLKLPAGALVAEKLVRRLTGHAPRPRRKSLAQLAATGLVAHVAPRLLRVGIRAAAPALGSQAADRLLYAVPLPNDTQALEASVWLKVIADMYGSSAPPAVTAWALLGFFLAPLAAKAAMLLRNEASDEAARATSWLFAAFVSTAAAVLSFAMPSRAMSVDSAVFKVLATMLLRFLAVFPDRLSESDLQAPTFASLQHETLRKHLLPALGGSAAAALAAQALGSGLPGAGGRAARAALFVALDSAFGRALTARGARVEDTEAELAATLQQSLAAASEAAGRARRVPTPRAAAEPA